MARAASVAALAAACQHRAVSTPTIPTFELRDGRHGTVDLVARVEGAEAVVLAGMHAGVSGEGTDDPATSGVRVVVFAAGDVLAARVRTAGASAYASKPDGTRERWFESSDGGRSWRPRTGAIAGAEVAHLGRGQVPGWDG
jgi:hypothetical protein